LPGTELAFDDNVKYDSRWFWTRRSAFRVGKLGEIDRHLPDRHHDTIEFPDGSQVLVTLLREGQRATVLQLPAVKRTASRPVPVDQPLRRPMTTD
jgi:hypothetical protein